MSLANTVTGIDGAFTSIPIIDLNMCNTPEGRLATAHEVRIACMRVGFFYVRHHGIPQSHCDNVLAAMRAYFGLSMETKMKLNRDAASSFKGYSPPLDSNIDAAHNNKGDFHESFAFTWEEIRGGPPEEEKRASGSVTGGVNLWPTVDCPEFRAACLDYYHAAVSVSKKLFPLFALALELPETFFDDKTRNPTAVMKPMFYPPQSGHPEIDDGTPGIGAHTDFECFTILWQQPSVQALQVMNAEKRWIDAPPIDGTLVINIGDQLALWTNDVFKSTVHRAVNKSGKERYSIPMFFTTDYDVTIEPVPSCVSADRPAKYGPVNAGEYVSKRLKEMYQYQAT